MSKLDIYYEGGTVDRWWIAPAGLGMAASKAVRVSKYYQTREAAMRALAARQDQDDES